MPYLRERDARAVLEVAHELAEADDSTGLTLTSLQRICVLLNAEVSAFTRIDVRAGSVQILLHPAEPRFSVPAEHLAATLSDNPIVKHWATSCDRQPRRVSDLVASSSWRATATYAEVLAPMGTEHLLGVPLHVPASGGPSYAFARSGRDFSDRDRDVAAALQVALVILQRRSQALAGTLGGCPSEVPPAADPARPRLTLREREILVLLDRGHGAQLISTKLQISPRTVRKHLEHVYAKLDAHDRLTAVNRARELQLL